MDGENLIANWKPAYSRSCSLPHGTTLSHKRLTCREADSARLFVIRADGSVISKQMRHSFWRGSLESLKLMPGDTIVVPDKIRTGGLLRGLRDWSQVFSQFALGAAAIKVISP